MDMSSKNKFVNIRQGNERLGELYGHLEDASKAHSVKSQSSRSYLLKDEGMVLIAQILLMSGCDGMIASYSSNVAILVHDLMHARKGSAYCHRTAGTPTRSITASLHRKLMAGGLCSSLSSPSHCNSCAHSFPTRVHSCHRRQRASILRLRGIVLYDAGATNDEGACSVHSTHCRWIQVLTAVNE